MKKGGGGMWTKRDNGVTEGYAIVGERAGEKDMSEGRGFQGGGAVDVSYGGGFCGRGRGRSRTGMRLGDVQVGGGGGHWMRVTEGDSWGEEGGGVGCV